MKRYFWVLYVFIGLALLSGCQTKTTTMDMGSHNGHQQPAQDQGSSATTKQIHSTWNFGGPPKANQQETLTIEIKDHNGNPIKEFETNHEKKMHLVVVSKDLAYFNHVHPQFMGDGKFLISATFPRAGQYKLFADFMPKGLSQRVESQWVTVQGEPTSNQPLLPDKNLTKTVDGKEVQLSFSKKIRANEEVVLDFLIRDAKTKKPLIDLEPYLGAIGHVVILSSDTKDYLHVHPMNESIKGPHAKFETAFPKKGIYKIWGQFKSKGKVFVIPFVVRVSA